MEPEPKSLLRSRTVWLALLVGAAAGLNALVPYLSGEALSLAVAAVSVVQIFLRIDTDRPIE